MGLWIYFRNYFDYERYKKLNLKFKVEVNFMEYGIISLMVIGGILFVLKKPVQIKAVRWTRRSAFSFLSSSL